MKVSTKALIYSLIVFPGSGYFIAKNKIKGCIVLSISLVCLAIFMIEAFHKAQIIAEKIVLGEIPYDINVIREQIPQITGVFSYEFITATSICIGVVWIIATIDSYRVAKKFD